MNYELRIGDAIVSCRDSDIERSNARDIKASRRFPPSCEEVPGEVDAFCAALTRHTRRSDISSTSFTWSMQRRRRAGLRSFPVRPPAG